MSFKDFVDRATDMVIEFPRFIEGMAEIADDFVNDVKVDTDEFVKEQTHMFREICTDKAYSINHDLGDALEKVYEIKDKTNENMKNLYYTIMNTQSAVVPKIPVKCISDLYSGDHIYVKRGVYSHHGIYIGDEEVIHYSPNELLDIYIQTVSVEQFMNGNDIYRMSKSESPTKYSGSEIVQRAKSRLYEESYNLLFNNCEHFVRWCRFGD